MAINNYAVTDINLTNPEHVDEALSVGLHKRIDTTPAANVWVPSSAGTAFTIPANTLYKVISLVVINLADLPAIYKLEIDSLSKIHVRVMPDENVILAKHDQPLYLPYKGTSHNILHSSTVGQSLKVVFNMEVYEQ